LNGSRWKKCGAGWFSMRFPRQSCRPMSRLRILLALLFAACLLAPAGAQQFRQPPPYRILVVNDDGVRAPGIAAVAQALQAIGTPIVVGPAENQTGKGHSIIT